ncbi:MAG: amino acid permease [Armatimonadetes bacterium]|nr:amino acid permease [Armatimonadota bacterium]
MAGVPRPTLGTVDAIAVIVGVVVGAGIFRTPSLVATHTGSELLFLLAWALGGGVSLVGALCYAELATAYPHAGGDYHYLTRAFGKELSFLFAWARITVIQTGSIATAAFVFGDYASQVLPLGGLASSPLYAAAAVALLTGLNMAGIRQGKATQNLLSLVKVLGLLLVVAAGILLAAPAPAAATAPSPSRGAFGLAMVFVLYTYGGWNEAAYISAEVRDARRNMLRCLLWGVVIITALYILASLAYLKGLGLAGVAKSPAVAADLMRVVMGETGARCVGVLIAVSALGATNATIFTGARSSYALGLDSRLFSFLGQWREGSETPVRALGAQGTIALFLVLLGALTRKGFETMVDYSLPVFWFFLLLTGLSLFVLRAQEPGVARPFRVPLYPLTPLLFCAMCLYMLHSSLAYAGIGAFTGLAVLLAGVPLLLLSSRHGKEARMAP